MKRNRIIWFSLFGISLIFIYFFGGPIPYTFFYAMCILPLITLLLNIIAISRFKYAQNINIKDTVKGQKIHFSYSVHNEGLLLYPYINIKFCNSDVIFAHNIETLSLTLKPLSSLKEVTILECRYRGRYTIGIDHFEFIDFLGIFRFRYRLKNPYIVTVYPMVVNIGNFSINTSFASETNSRLNSGMQDFTSIASIRKYSYGDSRRSVHWKLTAKLDELMVKKYEFTSESETTIMFDLCSYGLDKSVSVIVEDKLIEAVVAVINYCLGKYIRTSFIYYKERIISHELQSPNDFGGIYEFLSTVEFDQTVPIHDVADLLISEKLSKTNLILFTMNLGFDIYNTVCKAFLAGHIPVLIYISPEEASGISTPREREILGELAEKGISAYKLDLSSNTRDVLERPA